MLSTDHQAEAARRPTGPRPARRRRLLIAAVAAALSAAVAALAWTRPTPDGLYQHARADARAGRYDRAQATLDRLARRRAPTPDDHLLRAQVAAAHDRRPDDALAELAAIPDNHPLAPLARLSVGQLEARRGRLQRAEAAFLATLKLAPATDQARRELVYIYSIQQRRPALDEQLDALDRRGALDLTHLLHWGMVHQSEWAADIDLPALRRYLAADPDDRGSRLALVEALRRASLAAEAAETLAPLPDPDPDARAARVRLALDRGDRPGAEALLAAGPAEHPALARLRARMALARGNPAEAVRQYRIALAAEPDHATRHGLAAALAAAGDDEAAKPLRAAMRRHDEAGALLLQVRKEGLTDPTLPTRLGLACAEAGRPREARAWLNLAISRDPTDARAMAALHRLDHPTPDVPR